MPTSSKVSLGLIALLLGACSAPVDNAFSGDAAGPAESVAPTDDNTMPDIDAQEAALHGARDLGLLADAAPVDLEHASGYLVWTSQEGEPPVTHRLDAQGREVETLDGLYVATSAGIWQWKERTTEVHTTACEKFDEEGHSLPRGESEPGRATAVSLEHVSSGVTQELVAPDTGEDEMEEIDHGVRLVASVGPYLFIKESTYVYSCGAHGFTGMTATIWDAEKGAAITGLEGEALVDELREQAIAHLSADDELNETFPAGGSNTDFTEMVPTYANDATLEVGLQFTAPTCYACSDGRSSSYTRSDIVTHPTAPKFLAPYATPPAAVRAFAMAHPASVLGGWSATH